MNIGILEYDERVAYQLKEIINEECPRNHVTIWNQDSMLKEAVKEGCIYRVLFLSLEKASSEIIDYSCRLQELYPDLKIVYLTELRPVVFEVWEASPIYMLEKPLDVVHCKKAVHKAIKEHSRSKDKNFTIINRQGIFTIPYKKIFYVESDKRKLNIYGENGLIKSINLKISDFLKFEHGNYFLQCHKSYAVNLMHVSQIEKYEIILQNQVELPISQSRYTETKAGYVAFLDNE